MSVFSDLVFALAKHFQADRVDNQIGNLALGRLAEWYFDRVLIQLKLGVHNSTFISSKRESNSPLIARKGSLKMPLRMSAVPMAWSV